MSVSCECCLLSGSGLCYGTISRLVESYRVCACVPHCNLETSTVRSRLNKAVEL